jgi:hypothetical protein
MCHPNVKHNECLVCDLKWTCIESSIMFGIHYATIDTLSNGIDYKSVTFV